MKDQKSSVQSLRVYVLYGVLIALLGVSIILVIVAGTRNQNGGGSPSPTSVLTPTTQPTPQITPFTREMYEQEFLPADHTISINELEVSIDSVTAESGESIKFKNDSSLPVTVSFLGVNQAISALGTYEVLLELVGIYPYEISINNNTYTGTVTVSK